MNDVIISLYIELHGNVSEKLEHGRSLQRRRTWRKLKRRHGRRLKRGRRPTVGMYSSNESLPSESDIDPDSPHSTSVSPSSSLLSLETSPPPQSPIDATASPKEDTGKLRRKGARRMKQLHVSGNDRTPLSLSCSELNQLGMCPTNSGEGLPFKHEKMTLYDKVHVHCACTYK